MTAIEIRRAFRTDVSNIQDLARHTIDKSYRSFLGDDAVDAFIHSGESDKVIASNLEGCFVLTDNQKLRAFCIHSEAFIEVMMVAYTQQRAGYGSRLLAYVEALLFTQGYSTLSLETFKGNQQAINFYLKNGWTCIREEPDEEGGFIRVYFEKYAK